MSFFLEVAFSAGMKSMPTTRVTLMDQLIPVLAICILAWHNLSSIAGLAVAPTTTTIAIPLVAELAAQCLELSDSFIFSGNFLLLLQL